MLESPAASFCLPGDCSPHEGVAMPRRVLPAWSLLTAAFCAGVWAQAPDEDGPPDARADFGAARDLARARFEAAHADPRELARQKVEAARTGYQVAWQEFLAGRGALDVLVDWSRRLLEAERAAAPTPAARAAAFERQWEGAFLLEQVQEARYAAGRSPEADYVAARYFRLAAELRWARARQEKPGGPVRVGRLPRLTAEEPPGPDEEIVPEKELARAKFEAVHAEPRDLARQMRKAARQGYRAAARDSMEGRDTVRGPLDLVLEWLQRLAEAEAAVSDDPADRVAVLESCWAQAWEIEQIDEARHAAARIPVADYLDSRYARLDAEARWLQARRAAGAKARAAGGRSDVPRLPEDDDRKAGPGLRDFARARHAAEQADPRDLARQMLAVAREAYRSRWHEFLAGRDSLDAVAAEARRVLDAELAVGEKPADRAAAWERYWTWAKVVETVNEARYQAGRVPVRDLMEARTLRLDAEVHWAEAREKK
jgi:hypothetical protein